MLAAAVVVPVAMGWLRRRRTAPELVADPRYGVLRGRFEEARTRRVQGDAAAFLETMVELIGELEDTDEATTRTLDDLLERARYGGRIPPAEELDQLHRRVERRLASLRPDPERNEREAIRLAEEGE